MLILHAIWLFVLGHQAIFWWLVAGAISLVLSHQSQIDAWAERNPRLAGVMKLLRSLGLDPFMLLQSVSLIVRKKLPVKLQAAKLVAASGVEVSPEVKVEAAKQSLQVLAKGAEL